MKKILYIITQSDWGGAQRYVFDLATRLRQGYGGQANLQVYVAAGGDGALLTRLEARNLPTTRLKHLIRAINPYHDLMAYFELKKLLNHIKPDIVHLNSSKAGFIGSLAAKRCNIKTIIYTAHGFVFNEPLSAVKKWLYKTIELASSKRIDKIICVSDYDRQTGIATGMIPDKLVTIHNGLDPNINFLPKEQARLSLRAKRSNLNNALSGDDRIASVVSTLPRNDILIGCIANFYPTKGLDTLIQAMAKVDANLIIIGDGPEKKHLSAFAKASTDKQLQHKILFTGSIANASQYLKAFDLFVLPSRKEGLPYTLLEAQAAGIPIVATRVGGIPEIIEDKTNGYLVEPNNPLVLAEAINTALKQPLPSAMPFACTLEQMLIETLQVYAS